MVWGVVSASRSRTGYGAEIFRIILAGLAERHTVPIIKPALSRGHLPRLPLEHYCGFAFVHWVMTVDQRAKGWLDQLVHHRIREAMLHTAVRYKLFCPVYCLMADHVHLIWIGCRADSDQRAAIAFLRRCTQPLLTPHKWQREVFDHVLRDNERNQGGFSAICCYILENPVRKNLNSEWKSYPYCGAVIPGFPDLDPRRNDYWSVFWAVYNRQVEKA